MAKLNSKKILKDFSNTGELTLVWAGIADEINRENLGEGLQVRDILDSNGLVVKSVLELKLNEDNLFFDSNGNLSVNIPADITLTLDELGLSMDNVESQVESLYLSFNNFLNTYNTVDKPLVNDLKARIIELENSNLNILSQISDNRNMIVSILDTLNNNEGFNLIFNWNDTFIAGTANLNGISGKLVSMPIVMSDIEYSTFATPTQPTNGDLGELYITEKSTSSFEVKSTSENTMVSFDWLAVDPNLEGKAFNATSYPFMTGNTIVNGESLVVNLPSTLPSNLFKVILMPETAVGYTGEYWVSDKTTSSFKINLSGSMTDLSFDYLLIFNDSIPAYDPATFPIQVGSGTFNNLTPNSIQVMENVKYKVFITPTENPNGDLGDAWVTNKTINTFKVVSTGSATTSFDYIIVK